MSELTQAIDAVLYSHRAQDGEGANLVEAVLAVAEAIEHLAVTVENGPMLSGVIDVDLHRRR